jgi:hypothetical protein
LSYSPTQSRRKKKNAKTPPLIKTELDEEELNAVSIASF